MALLVPGTVLPDSIQRMVLAFLTDTAATASVLTIGSTFSAIRWVSPNLPGLALHMFGFDRVGIRDDGSLRGDISDLRVIRLNGGTNPADDGPSQTFSMSQLIGAQAVLDAARDGSGPFNPANYQSFYELLDTGSNGLLMLSDLVEGRVEGTTGNDTLRGGSGNNVFFASEGDDTISGGGGRDMVTACHQANSVNIDLAIGTGTMVDSQGQDVGTMVLDRITSLRGSQAADVLVGNDSRNVILGCDGDDLIRGAGGRDRLDGEKGHDTLRGGAGSDLLEGSSGEDVLFGEGGNDRLFGGADNDRLSGGVGDDDLAGGRGNDRLSGNDGADRLDGGDGADQLDGGENQDTLFGAKGADSLMGGGDNDLLFGGASRDTLEGAEGMDTLDGNSGDDVLSGGSDADRCFGGSGNDTLDGGHGNDVLRGGSGNDRFLFSGSGNDLAFGEAGNDVFDLADSIVIDRLVNATGGDGDDVFISGAGIWRFDGGTGNDRFEFNDALTVNDSLESRMATGGDGEDVFVLNAQEAHIAILDFFPLTDQLILGFLPGRVESIMDVGNTAVVTMRSGGTYTFVDVSAAVIDPLFA